MFDHYLKLIMLYTLIYYLAEVFGKQEVEYIQDIIVKKEYIYLLYAKKKVPF